MPRKRLFPPPRAPDGRRLQNKGREPHSVLTANDRIDLWRTRWYSPAVGGVTPADAWLDAAEAAVSLGARELACRLNQGARSFQKAADNLTRAAQIRLSDELLRQVVEAEGKAVLAAHRDGTLTIPWSGGDCRVTDADGRPTGTTRVYLGADGVKAPLVTDQEKRARRRAVQHRRRRCGRKRRPLPRAKRGADQRYKEFKVVTYYDQDQEHRHVAVTRGDHQAAGRLMRRDAGRIRLTEAGDKVGLFDGADWIKNQVKRQGLPLDDVGLDFYHLAENVHKARRAVYGEEDPHDSQAPGNAWAAGLLHTAKHQGYRALQEELVAWKAKRRGPKQRAAAQRLLEYADDRREMIKYPEFLAQGRHIGSGPTESMCRATTERLKGVGMRWDADNAEALMALEALDQSGQWGRYWAVCLRPVA
jgi:hypothetical protein